MLALGRCGGIGLGLVSGLGFSDTRVDFLSFVLGRCGGFGLGLVSGLGFSDTRVDCLLFVLGFFGGFGVGSGKFGGSAEHGR